MDKGEAIEIPQRPFLRSQTKEMQVKVDGLQRKIKKMFIVEEEPKNYSKKIARSYTYFMVQVQEEDWAHMEPHYTPKRG